MIVKTKLLFFVIIYSYGKTSGEKTFSFTNCYNKGFSCTTKGAFYNVTYQCSNDGTEDDLTLHVWNFESGPYSEDITALTIQSCETLRLSFECRQYRPYFSTLIVRNITNLVIIPANFTHNPMNIIFDNLTIPSIPPNTFSQIKSKSYKPSGCYDSLNDLREIHFNNVTIGTINSGAFDDLKNLDNFKWLGVKINRLQHNAIKINSINSKNGNFSLRKCRLQNMEHLALQIIGTSLEIIENDFVDLHSSAINGTVENFKFIANNIDNMESKALSISAQNINIEENKFKYLKSNAFSGLTPGVLKNEFIKFRDLKFGYTFTNNFLNYLEAGSLNPDILSFKNVLPEIKFDHNAFYCTCENLGWLVSDIGHGYNTKELQGFYQTVIDEKYKNICASCKLPLIRIKDLLHNGKCLENRTADICTDDFEQKLKSETSTPIVDFQHFNHTKLHNKGEKLGFYYFNMFMFILLVYFSFNFF